MNRALQEQTKVGWINAFKKNEQALMQSIEKSWEKIAPFWPLSNLIAVNPLQGFEDLPIEKAMIEGKAHFQQKTIPPQMQDINRETIKWCQAFFDEGQSGIAMPMRQKGLYLAWKQLAIWDVRLHNKQQEKRKWLKQLPLCPKQAIEQCLIKLEIPKKDHEQFLTLMLTTLAGWSSYVKYLTDWEENPVFPIQKADFLAIRLIITYLLWPGAKQLLFFHKQAKIKAEQSLHPINIMQPLERVYHGSLLKKLAAQNSLSNQAQHTPKAQFIFCIDVRSEPFRRALEAAGDYETFGFAGFFGVPVRIEDQLTCKSYPSCPVLLSPKHNIKKEPLACHQDSHKHCQGYQTLSLFKRLYQSLKYTFTTPFALAETLGPLSGIWMAIKSLFPKFASSVKQKTIIAICPDVPSTVNLQDIALADQCIYAANALHMIGLTENFAPIVVLSGHGSETENNAYASSLDCGACGGRHGCSSAKILAQILNSQDVRRHLAKQGLIIPKSTLFMAAKHNTTTDEMIVYDHDIVDNNVVSLLAQIKRDLSVAQETNSEFRCRNMNVRAKSGSKHTNIRSVDWAQVRPEWGLAKNSAFIVGPRDLTKHIDLEGRCFLHSYDYKKDPKGESLTTILTAPMVVAQWINSQYLFSTLDNVAYGAGSKVTKNITGKIGVMQGNASDLMHGLTLQSVYESDRYQYHQPLRLMTVVYAPKDKIKNIVLAQPALKKLVSNGWIKLACIEPIENQNYIMDRKLQWERL